MLLLVLCDQSGSMKLWSSEWRVLVTLRTRYITVYM